ncbi:hypothetical protein GCM10011297_19390 [Bacterioplanes sanyensis]|uniref:DUF3570 domain-containing protein n=1 Tax=Bacterioplanes sanyensis TaxID=1249553 RepID=UPI0016736F7E|nr:DUF3570 domain-containing protein [Bacterioplanes sanyensis]GGY46663.1 hypothetical protein GCM10011297_19390 [Bacterioplanes sanyensis]
MSQRRGWYPLGLACLLTTLIACPLAAATPYHSDQLSAANEVGYRYSSYQQAGVPANRVVSGRSDGEHYQAHQLHWRQQLAAHWQLQANARLEDSDGALVRQTYRNDAGQSEVIMSSARLEDRRRYLRVGLSRQFNQIRVGGSYSQNNEDGCDARGFGMRGELLFNQGNTVISAGYRRDNTTLSATNAMAANQRPLADNATRQQHELYAGVSQVINRYETLQVTLAQQFDDGFLTDPYRTLDRRPDERLGHSIHLLYRMYVPHWRSALHWDYRYYQDDWEVSSHSLEGRWLQDVTPYLRWRIALRGYQQSEAEFYSLTANQATSAQSSDARLSAYGALQLGLGFDVKLAPTTVSLDWSRYESREQWGPAGKDAAEAPTLVNYQLLSLGVLYRY